ncbi:hypothetical protein MJ560_03935 [Klebsiella pneumoniae]|nr:hypothetical protein MJ560_03935 [Klebsiella pneumoniae]
MAQKADNVKAWLKNDETFSHYLGEVWGDDLRGWVKNDISSDEAHVLSSVSSSQGSGSVKPYSATTRCANHLTNAPGAGGAPGGAGVRRLPHPPYRRHGEELGRPRDISRQIELNIGKDLQFIRINGCPGGGNHRPVVVAALADPLAAASAYWLAMILSEQ